MTGIRVATFDGPGVPPVIQFALGSEPSSSASAANLARGVGRSRSSRT